MAVRLRSPVRAIVGVLLAASGCVPSPEAPQVDVVCEPPLPPPVGFEEVERVELPEEDHVGVRVTLRADDGRELHLLAGIPGEIGEGLPLVASVPLAEGREARLLGADERWVLAWESDAVCDPYAVIGVGFDRRGFLALLKDVGFVRSA